MSLSMHHLQLKSLTCSSFQCNTFQRRAVPGQGPLYADRRRLAPVAAVVRQPVPPTWAPTPVGSSSSTRAAIDRPVTVATAAPPLSASINVQSGSSWSVQLLRTDRRNQTFLADHSL